MCEWFSFSVSAAPVVIQYVARSKKTGEKDTGGDGGLSEACRTKKRALREIGGRLSYIIFSMMMSASH